MTLRKPFCIIQPGKPKSQMLAEAVMTGAGGVIHVGNIQPNDIPDYFTPVIIGVHLATIETLLALSQARRPFVTVDNGYFRPYSEGGYFRATTNALQWIARHAGFLGRHGGIEGGAERFAALDLPVSRWRGGGGKYVLLALQSPLWLRMMMDEGSAAAWLEGTTQAIRACTGRDIVVRLKPLKGVAPQPSLEAQIARAQVVAAFSSNVLIKASLLGVPVLPLAACAASPLRAGSIDSPAEPTRRLGVFHDLAANQWTVDEIKSGRMWRDLGDRYDPEFLPLA